MKRTLLIFFMIILISGSCEKDDLLDVEYFAFGTAYGECIGNCAKFYMIKDNSIFPDDIDYYSGALSFSSQKLAEAKYLLAKKLVDDFPQYLVSNPNSTYGCPDCADQGGIHIEIKENNDIKLWHIDTVVANQPEDIRAYISELLGVLAEME